MRGDLFSYQAEALDKLRTGSILVGGVGSGKSRTALAYYEKAHNGRPLYIITTPKKRDTNEWLVEFEPFGFSTRSDIVVDSWNNIRKYVEVKGAFFIFDEQRLVGNGTWVKTFLKIAKANDWILLSATPGDTWMDYIPVFVANGFYKNRTEFVTRHVVFNPYTTFPSVKKYLDIDRLSRFRDSILVELRYKKHTVSHHLWAVVGHDEDTFRNVHVSRWNPYTNRPIKNAAELYYVLRKVVNTDSRRLGMLIEILDVHPKVIVFYNFDYERELLWNLGRELGISTAEWNGHRHQKIPDTDQWMYIVQYSAGAEGWNCVDTDTVVFYSQSYSYRATVQAAGRIDRLNTTFKDLYYYHFRSISWIDSAIKEAYDKKQNFNERRHSLSGSW